MGKVKISPRYQEYLDTKQCEVRHGRNFIRHGDLVRVRPSAPGRHDGYKARFQYAATDRGGLHYVLHELDGGKYRCIRTVKPEAVVRTATTRDPGTKRLKH